MKKMMKMNMKTLDLMESVLIIIFALGSSKKFKFCGGDVSMD